MEGSNINGENQPTAATFYDSALIKAQRNGKVKLLAEFGGQGAAYLPDLKQMYRGPHKAVHTLIEEIASIINTQLASPEAR
jgi:hypothetical protein